jgi:alpha-mannosidase
VIFRKLLMDQQPMRSKPLKTLHVISHTHWDREWYLTFQQFRLKLVHLIDKLLDILEQDPEFKHFMLDGQTIILDDYLQIRPENEDKLRNFINDGRILIGPWHILPDMFLVSPEGHIRNLLEGARTARKFGQKMLVGYIPDPFGHPGQVPQILTGFGIEAAALWRGLSTQPVELWWESPDGSRILLAYLRDSYGNGANLPLFNNEAFTNQISAAGESLAAHSAADDYLIMLGTDHMEPSPYTSRAIAYANAHLLDTQVIHSTLPDYIETISSVVSRLDGRIPIIKGELRACDRSPLLPGVLSSRMWIKQRNHHSQTLLEKWAEPFSVFAERFVTDPYSQTHWVDRPAEEISANRVRKVTPIIRKTWCLLMENHPHDSICGCSIDQVHDEMKPRFDQVDQVGEEITLQALQAISQAVNTQADNALSAIVIFNPYGFLHRDRVEVKLNIPEQISHFKLVDEDGVVIPHEFLGSSNQEIANLLLTKHTLRDTIGTITEGWVAGSAIVSVKVARDESLVTIHAILDDKGQPNILEWQQAEIEIANFETDPSVTHFHLIARTPQAAKIAFISPEIPNFGWQTVWLHAVDTPETGLGTEVKPLFKPLLPLAMRFAQTKLGGKIIAKLSQGDETKPPFYIENEFFRVEVDPTDGTLDVTDKHTGAVFTGLNQFVDGGDAGDEYNYSPPLADSFFTPQVISMKAYRHRVFPSLEIEYLLKIPTQLTADRKSRASNRVSLPIFSQITLLPGVPRIEVQTQVENLAKDHRLRVHFPAPFTVEEAHYDGHFEVVQRPIGVPQKGSDWVEDPRPEVPQRAFAEISNGEIGLIIANRGLPEVEVVKQDQDEHTEIAITLLRCVGWLSRDDLPMRQGHAGPGKETPGAQMLGKCLYDYAIIPHQTLWMDAIQPAYTFETPLRAIETEVHDGELPPRGSFISHTPAEFMVSAVKEAEDGKGWLVRGYNLSSQSIQLSLKPYQHFTRAVRVNLAEEEMSRLKMEIDGSLKLPVSGHEIVSILFLE